MFTIVITMTMIISINIMIIFLIIILIIVFFILIIMILVIVMRPRARLTPHLPVNYGNSLQVSTHGRPAPRSKNRALKSGLQHTAAHCTAHHFHPMECKGQALHCKLLEAKCKADVCCPAWFHCKPRTALCCTACHNSAWIAAHNSTLCAIQCSADTV